MAGDSKKKSRRDPRLPKGEPTTSRASTGLGALLFIIFIAVGAFLGGVVMDDELRAIVLPPPSPPRDPELQWDDFRLRVLVDESQLCDDRVGAILGLYPCDRHPTLAGQVVRCDIAWPYNTLSLSCEERSYNVFRERVWLDGPTPAMSSLQIKASAHLQLPCQGSLVGPLAGEPPRWPGDEGAARCFLIGGMRELTPQTLPVAVGAYFEFDPARLPTPPGDEWFATTKDAPEEKLRPRRLVIDTQALDDEEMKKMRALMRHIFYRDLPAVE